MEKRLYLYVFGLAVVLIVSSLQSGAAIAQTCPQLPTNTGTVTGSISVSSAGTYKVWSRMLAKDTTNNSFWLQIDSQCAVAVGDSSALSPNVWTWVDYKGGSTTTKATFSLTAGTHTIKIIGKEANVSVDKLIFMSDMTCVPTGFGSNCSTVTSTPTSAPKPTSTPFPTSTPVPGAARLQVQMLLHGIGKGGDNSNASSVGNFSILRPQRQVTVEIYNSQNQLLLTKQGTITFDTAAGNFNGTVDIGTSLANGTYLVKIVTPQYLKSLVPGIQTITRGMVVSLPKTALVAGDISGDNVINVIDYNVLAGCYSDLTPAISCNTTTKTASDLNDDGNVNQFDYNLFIRELNTRSGQ